MVRVWEAVAVGEFNHRSILGKVVVNPPQSKSEIKPRKLEDEWFICNCGKGYSNFETYEKHKIDHENNTIKFKPTWSSYPKFNPTNNNNKDSDQVKVKTIKKKNENQSNPKNGKAKFVSKLKSVDSSKIGTRSIKCKICHQFFYYVGRLRQHMDAKHPEEAKTFVIPKINKQKQKAIVKAKLTSKKPKGSIHLQKVTKIKRIIKIVPKSSEAISSKKDLDISNNKTKNKISKTNKPKILKESTAKKSSKNITSNSTSGNYVKLPVLKDKNTRKNLFPCPHCKKTNYLYSKISLSNHIELKHFDKVSTNEKIKPVATNTQPTSTSSSSLPPSQEEIKQVRKSRKRRKILTLQGQKIARKSALNSLANSQAENDDGDDNDDVNNPLPPVLTPIHKKIPRKSNKHDTNNISRTTISTKGAASEQVSKNIGSFFYDAIGTRTRSKNMDDDISPPTLDLMEDKLEDESSIQTLNNKNNNNNNSNLPNASKSPYSKSKIQTEKTLIQQTTTEKLQCTMCVHKFPSNIALQLHLKHHKVVGVYNKMKANNNKNNGNSNNNNIFSVLHRSRQNSVKPTSGVLKNTPSKNDVTLINTSPKVPVKMKTSSLLSSSPPRLSPAPGITKSPINYSPKNQSPKSSLSPYQTTTESNNNVNSSATQGKGFPCELCPKVLTAGKYLKVHMMAHTKFTCSVCSKKFTFKRHLEKHLKCVHPDGKIENQTIPSNESSFVTEESSNSNTPESIIGQRSKRAKKLLQEVQTSSIPTSSNSKEKQKQQKHRSIKPGNLVTCSTCNVRISKYMLHHHHKVAHSTQIEYKCEECTRSFETFRALESHKRCSHKLNTSQSSISPPQEKAEQLLKPSSLRLRIERKRNGRLKTNIILPESNNTGNPLQESHKVQETMKCDLCKFDIPGGAEGVLLHKQVAHVKNGDFQCHMCSCRYRTKTGLSSHLRNKIHTEENTKTATNGKGTNNQVEEKRPPPSTSSSSSLDVTRRKPSPPIIKIKDEEEIKFQKDTMTVPKIICYYSQNPEFLRTQNSPQKNATTSQNSRPHSASSISSTNNDKNNSGDKVKHQALSGSHYGIKDKSVTITPINNKLNNTLGTPPRIEKVSTINNFPRSVSNLSTKNTNNNNNSVARRNSDIQRILSNFQRAAASATNKTSTSIKQPFSTLGAAVSSNKFRSSYPVPSLGTQKSKTNLPEVVTCNICEKTFFSEKRLSVHLQEHMGEAESKQEKCGYCGNKYSVQYIFTHLQHCRGVNSPVTSPNTTPTKNENVK